LRNREKLEERSLPEIHRLPRVVRTGEGLRNALFDEIDALRDGTGDRRRALTIVEIARQIIKIAWLEVELARQIPEGGDPLQLNAVPTINLGGTYTIPKETEKDDPPADK
jgi:hypothetical protein